MNKTKKTILIHTIGLLLFTSLKAQDTIVRHEVSVHGALGLSSLQYKVNEGTQSKGLGGNIGIGYTYFLTSKMGLTTGAEFTIYNAKATLKNDISGSYATTAETPAADNNMTFTYTLHNYKEQQQAYYLTIPLMLQYQSTNKRALYIAAGAKIGIPLSATYKVNPYTLNTQGYFSAEKRTYDNLPEFGLGEFENPTAANKKLNLGISYMAAFETGIKWELGSGKRVYTGVYVDYGLNNTQKNTAQPEMIEYAGNEQPLTHSVLQSQANNTLLVSKISSIAAGLKITYALGVGKTKKIIKQVVAPLEIHDPVVLERIIVPVPKAAFNNKIIQQQKESVEAEKKSIEEIQQEAVRLQKEEIVKAQAIIQQPLQEYSMSQIVPSATQKQMLDEKIVLLKKYAQLRISLEGHTCNIGAREVNKQISLKRAEAAKEYLIAQGIDPLRIQLAAFGSSRPIAPNTNEEGRQKNRRVEAVILE